jgi:hypothetical protein
VNVTVFDIERLLRISLLLDQFFAKNRCHTRQA